MPMQPIRRSVPVKGMNTVAPPRAMSEEYSPVLENTWYDDGITLRRRLCHSISNTTVVPAAGVKEIFEYSYGGTTKRFIQDTAGLLSLDTGTAYTSQTQTFTGEIGSASLKARMVVGDGVANAKVYNGSTWAAPTVTPAPVGDATIGNIFHTHRGRVYAAGNTTFPMTLFVSDTIASSGVNYWSQVLATGQQGFLIDCTGDISSGDEITGITTHRGFLVVFCRNHILFYTISESAGYTSSLYKVIQGEGCVSGKSIQAIGEETIFLSPNGFKKLSVSLIQGDSQVNDLSSPINNEVKDLLNGGTVVEADIRSTYNPRYGLYICTLGTTQWAYQTQFESWYRWTGLNRVLFTDSTLTTYSGAAYMCTLSNTVFRDEFTPAAFTAVNYRWTPSPFRSPNLEHKPRWRRLELVYETDGATEDVTFSYYLDLDFAVKTTATYTLTPTETLENGMNSGKFELPIVGRSELISFDISNNANSDFRCKIVEVYMNDGGLR